MEFPYIYPIKNNILSKKICGMADYRGRLMLRRVKRRQRLLDKGVSVLQRIGSNTYERRYLFSETCCQGVHILLPLLVMIQMRNNGRSIDPLLFQRFFDSLPP